MAKRHADVMTVQIPEADIVFADARIYEIVQRSLRDANIVESVSRSCYLQGLRDGVRLALEDADLLAEIAP